MRQKGFLGFVGKISWTVIVAFLILGWHYPIIGSVALICMIAPPLLAVLKGGRVWCGTACPRGSFNDNILAKVSRSVNIPRVFRTVFFRVAFFIFLVYNFIDGIIQAKGDLIKIGYVFYKIIFITTAITILLGIIFNERTWCSFCPMGSLSALITKVKRRLRTRPKRIVVDRDKCVDCKLCEKECPMGLKPYDFTGDNDKDLDCIHCQECVYKCPVNALDYK
ncbi:4Fe-4S binding protein [Orenia metallireducens]|jgi:polyferredoxin|uniref:4Fe-4S binding domain-containing protein n=1 Tax=Orenia metallireducens TaxID=1413210 RepID=A0A285GNJ9_9FIRM|nr:4Fe-4S binding protein [Orenia metallireducens]PRX29811.1 4Fe-4S binding protein [Orenia metallireducens]SNY25045.1 4Fe-4S binding domain-containing protein [Orenia metallireducens]